MLFIFYYICLVFQWNKLKGMHILNKAFGAKNLFAAAFSPDAPASEKPTGGLAGLAKLAKNMGKDSGASSPDKGGLMGEKKISKWPSKHVWLDLEIS